MAEAFSWLSLSLDGGEVGGGVSVGFGPQPVQPVYATVTPVTPTLPTKPCKLYVDVRCERGPETVRFLAFRNLYTAYVAVKARVSTDVPSSSPSSSAARHRPHQHEQHARWHGVLASHRCMEDPHYEDDAQALHVVELPSETLDGVPLNRVTALRVYIYQPSPRWAALDVGIRHVAIFSSGTPRSIRAAMLTHISRRNKNGAEAEGGHRGGDLGDAADMRMEWDDDWTSGGAGGRGGTHGAVAGAPGIGGGGPGSPAAGSPTTSLAGGGALEPSTVAGILTASADVRAALESMSKARAADASAALSADGGDPARQPGTGGGGERGGASKALFGAVALSAAEDEILYAV